MMEHLETLKRMLADVENGDEHGVKPDLTESEIGAIRWAIETLDSKTVSVVTVFESGDGKTEPWKVLWSKEEADIYANDLLEDKTLNNDNLYLEVTVTTHQIE